MSEKLSDRLEQHGVHCALCSDPGSDAVYTPDQIGELAGLIRQATAIVRAVGDAPVAYLHGKTRISPHASAIGTDGRPTPGKRVKLVEVK